MNPIEILLEHYRSCRAGPTEALQAARDRLSAALDAEMRRILKGGHFTRKFREAVLEEVPSTVFLEWERKGDILPNYQPGGAASQG
ncbi:MAG: hypothetical protein Q8Q28_01205 [Pseudomonadota bacterium]|nr:hypothetical protein [Pseudomonadota bacterium]